MLLIELERLLTCGLPPVLLCRPMPRGGCSAPRHVPCGRQSGKHPLMRGYGAFAESSPTLDDLVAVTRRVWPVNVGIVTGSQVVVIEADSPDAEAEVVSMAGCALHTPTRAGRPGRGRAWVFRAPSGTRFSNRAKLGSSGAIDVRGDAGILVVPPSRHRSGHQHRWVVAPWEQDLMVIPEPLVKLAWRPPSPHARKRTGSASGVAISSRVRTLIEANSHIAELWRGTGKRGGDQSASGHDFSLALHLLRRRVPPSEVAVALAARPGTHRHDLDYCRSTVENARHYIERHGSRP